MNKILTKFLVHPLPLGKKATSTYNLPLFRNICPQMLRDTFNHLGISQTKLNPYTSQTNHLPFWYTFYKAKIATTTIQNIGHNLLPHPSKYNTQITTPYSIHNITLNSQYPGTNQINTTRCNKYTTIQSRVQ